MRKFAWLPIALVVAGCSVEHTGETQREQQSIELDGSASTRVSLEMSAGELNALQRRGQADGGCVHL